VNVASGHYVNGQRRLLNSSFLHADTLGYADQFPPGSPTHAQSSYAFKAHALKAAAEKGYRLLLWADASVKPVRSLEPLWERIERDGYWIQANDGWNNWQWTAQAAYDPLEITEEENQKVTHVMAISFGIDLESETGGLILDDYIRLAKSGAFNGHWKNDRLQAHPNPKVLGHRHDQTALSIIAHRLGCKMTAQPEPLAYLGRETPKTILIADGNY